MADPQELLEEIEELRGRLTALTVEFPQIELFDEIERLGDVLKGRMNPMLMKFVIEDLYGLNTLFEKLLADRKYDNTWHLVKPCYVLVTGLLSADE